jgi:hypothetical protein
MLPRWALGDPESDKGITRSVPWALGSDPLLRSFPIPASASLCGTTTCRDRRLASGLSGIFGSAGPRVCRMLHPEFGELPFPRTPVNKPAREGPDSVVWHAEGASSRGHTQEWAGAPCLAKDAPELRW